MKHIFLLFPALLLTALLASAQNPGLTRFIEKHRYEKPFTYAYLSKDLYEVVSKSRVDDKDWKKLQGVVQNIGSLRILAADSISNGNALYKEAFANIRVDDLDELLTVHDGQDDVRIWVKSEDDKITDLILLVGTSDAFVLVCFSGALELGNISELARLFDAREAETLARNTEAIAIHFKVNPNPSNGEFTLSYPNVHDLPAALSVLDQSGRMISTLELSGTETQRIKFPDLPTGLYWLQLKTQGGKIGIEQIQIVR